MESLILAQDKRWRRALSMQVGRTPQGVSGGRLSKTEGTYRVEGDNPAKAGLRPRTLLRGRALGGKPEGAGRGASGPSGRWCGKGAPSR